MRILTVLTYYRPHTSGLTIYAERLARALAKRGHQVTVFTTQYEKTLPPEETLHGVRVIRAPVLLRFSKAVFSPAFGLLATRLVKEHDVVQLHLPQLDAPGVALRGRLFHKPTVMTYHCDITLPGNPLNIFLNPAVSWVHHLAARLVDRIVTYTQDYADNSSLLSRYQNKLQIIPPPVELPQALNGTVEAFTHAHDLPGRRPVIGMAARFATEKGVEVLLEALPNILAQHPRALVLFAGQYQDVLGEQEYYNRLMPAVRKYQEQGHWMFLGVLNPSEMSAFYPNLDILVVPSLNSTEAFGLVQIEAMMNGVPCVASSLPGVRQPVLTTGMGQVVPIGDSGALASAILAILDQPDRFRQDPLEIARRFTPDAVAARYEEMFEELLGKGKQVN